MRLRCNLRELRGDRTIAEIARAAGVPEPELSKIERGIELPRDEWIAPLERAYGHPFHDWYPPSVRQALIEGQGTGAAGELLIRGEEIIGARQAARGFAGLVRRITEGDLEKAVIVWRNQPRAVLLSIGRYTELATSHALSNLTSDSPEPAEAPAS